MANLHCSNGKLGSLYSERPDDTEPVIEVGSPLVIRYLYVFLQHRGRSRRSNLMLSTFVKTEETRAAAAEAVNYYHPRAPLDGEGAFRLADFGGEHYGHPLCYYTRSYLGETIRLTTRAMELDRLDRQTLRALRSGIANIAGLPIFTDYLGWLLMISSGARVAEKLMEFLARDEVVIESHSLDLHHGATRHRRLRPGRIVCVPGAEEMEFVGSEAWYLAPDNRLREAATGREYTARPYFVLEALAEEHPAYEEFDYFQGVAELLRRTNRPGRPADLITEAVGVVQGYSDFRLIDRIENIALRQPAGEEREHLIHAAFRLLTPRGRRFYEARLRELTGRQSAALASV